MQVVIKLSVWILIMFFFNYCFAQDNKLETKKSTIEEIKLIDSRDMIDFAKNSKNKNTIIYTFGIWCAPCRLHIENAVNLKKDFDVDLFILLIDNNEDVILTRSLNFLKEYDPEIKVILLKNDYGNNRNRRYKKFLKEITPERFENLNGMSKYIVLNKKGIIEMVTTWKDNRNYDWQDDSNMLKEKVIPLLKRK